MVLPCESIEDWTDGLLLNFVCWVTGNTVHSWKADMDFLKQCSQVHIPGSHWLKTGTSSCAVCSSPLFPLILLVLFVAYTAFCECFALPPQAEFTYLLTCFPLFLPSHCWVTFFYNFDYCNIFPFSSSPHQLYTFLSLNVIQFSSTTFWEVVFPMLHVC